MRRLLTSSLVLAGIAATACASRGGATDETGGAIINGREDRTHPAVVAVFSGSSTRTTLCSGTIVKKDVAKEIAWVVTAAHCVDTTPTVVLLGNDLLSYTTLRYSVVDYAADPQYSGENGFLHDFAVLRVAGIDATTPVIPLAEGPDDLVVGSSVTSIGYGRTTPNEPTPESQNTKRNAVDKKLSAVNENHIAFDQSSRGICMGDSGGPVLARIGGTEEIPDEDREDRDETAAAAAAGRSAARDGRAVREGDEDAGVTVDPPAEHVVGVHSFVQGGCGGRGVSGRISAGASFFATQLAKMPPPDDCNLCLKIAGSGTHLCAAAALDCRSDPQCNGFTRCVASQKPVAECAKEFPLGEGPYRQTAACGCTKACASECARDAKCAAVPKCGFKMGGTACTACVDGACCAEESACAGDPVCVACMRNDAADPRCAENVARTKLVACASICSQACAEKPSPPPVTSPDQSPGAASATDDLATQAEPDVPTVEGPPPASKSTHGNAGCATGVGPASVLGAGEGVFAIAIGLPLLGFAVRRRRRRASV